MVDEKLTDEGLPFLQDDLNRLRGLNQSDLPGYNSQDTCLVSAGDETGRRGLRKEAAQTGTPLLGEENAGLPLKLEDTSINKRLDRKKGGVIYQVLRREVVRSIDDDVIVRKDLEGILRRQTLLISDDLHIRIDSTDRISGRIGF